MLLLNKTNNKGVTLIEMLIVLSLIGVIAMGAVSAVSGRFEKQKIIDGINDLTIIRDLIDDIYAGKPSYKDLDADTLIASGGVPVKLLNVVKQAPPTVPPTPVKKRYLVNRWNTGEGAVVVTPGTAGDTGTADDTVFSIVLSGIDQSVCARFVTKTYSGYKTVKVNGLPVSSFDEIVAACGAAAAPPTEPVDPGAPVEPVDPSAPVDLIATDPGKISFTSY